MTSYEIIELCVKRLEGIATLVFDKKYKNYIFCLFLSHLQWLIIHNGNSSEAYQTRKLMKMHDFVSSDRDVKTLLVIKRAKIWAKLGPLHFFDIHACASIVANILWISK